MSSASYPPPPPFYRLYKNYSQDPNSAPSPPPPIEGTYICFGATHTWLGGVIEAKSGCKLGQWLNVFSSVIVLFLDASDLFSSFACSVFVVNNSLLLCICAAAWSGLAFICAVVVVGLVLTDNVLPSLEEQGVRQLYPKGPNVDYKKELRSLVGELLLHLLELADILIQRPSQFARRVEEISTVYKNMHHLLNSMRPHQARATLIHIMELQIQRRKEALEDIKRRREESQKLLNESLAALDGN
ncbi:hypothetical protein Lal_00013016 [Lupinus albus]|nr:hypothetical protein Lal_00013016 [Lupinus albus]